MRASFEKEAGIYRTYVSMIEREIGNPTLTVLADLAEALDTTLSTLARELEGKDWSRTPPGPQPPFATTLLIPAGRTIPIARCVYRNRVRMERQVVPEGHAVAGSYWPNQRAEGRTAARIICRPVRKIENPARVLDVSYHLPRNWRDVCPDRPTRLARVTVVACAPQNPLYITRRVGVYAQVVCTLNRHDLDGDEHSGQ